MAALLGVDVDRTISATFVIGAALAAVAGLMVTLYYGVIDFYHRLRRRHQSVHRGRAGRHRLAARRDAGRLADRHRRSVLVGLFQHRLQGRGGFRRFSSWCSSSDPPACSAARRGKSLMAAAASAPPLSRGVCATRPWLRASLRCWRCRCSAFRLVDSAQGLSLDYRLSWVALCRGRRCSAGRLLSYRCAGGALDQRERRPAGRLSSAAAREAKPRMAGGRWSRSRWRCRCFPSPTAIWSTGDAHPHLRACSGRASTSSSVSRVSRSRLRRVLCRRRLFLRAAVAELRPVVLGLPAAARGFSPRAFGLLLGFPVLRLRGDYLAIVTLGFGADRAHVSSSIGPSLTGGPNGISGIARPSFFGLALPPSGRRPDQLRRVLRHSVLAGAADLFSLLPHPRARARRRRSSCGASGACPWDAPGRRCAKTKPPAVSLGLNPTAIKLSAFALGAFIAGIAGSFFATRQGFISPESFTFIETAIILAIVVLGGMGSQLGIVLAAILLVGLPEWFRDLEEYRMVAFGAAMVLIMLWRPRRLLRTAHAHRLSLKERQP